MRRTITDFEDQIATCCTASEEGMVCIIQDAVTGQGNNHGIALVDGEGGKYSWCGKFGYG